MLALLAQAAEGNTFEELKLELHLYGDKSSVAKQFHLLYEFMQKGAGNSSFVIANRIYVKRGYEINKIFQEVATQQFLSDIESINFENSFETAGIINNFVEAKTNGKITDLIKPDALSDNTSTVLVNAIYFKSDWENMFNEDDTVEEDFYMSVTERVPVDFMYIRTDFNYATLPDLDATALEMKYANSNFSFIIILPNNRTGFSEMETKLKRYNLATITDQKMFLQEVDVKIPKFKVEFEITLKDTLKNVSISI